MQGELLKNLESRVAELRASLAALSAKLKAYETVLEHEALQHVGKPHSQLSLLPSVATAKKPIGRTPLSRAIVIRLLDQQWHSLSDILSYVKASGYDFGDRNPGRSATFTLQSFRQFKYVERNESDGTWRLTPAGAEAAKNIKQSSPPSARANISNQKSNANPGYNFTGIQIRISDATKNKYGLTSNEYTSRVKFANALAQAQGKTAPESGVAHRWLKREYPDIWDEITQHKPSGTSAAHVAG